MNANRKFTSFETNKLLKGCSVESEYVYLQHKANDTIIFTNKRCDYENNFGNNYNKEELNDFPAFTWNEILWECSDEILFGKYFHYTYIIVDILIFLNEKEYDKADEYLREKYIELENMLIAKKND